MELYKPFKSKAKNKKYSVYVKGGKLIHFGDKRYGQYKDKIGLYSHLDHNDKKKRESYHSRFGPTGKQVIDFDPFCFTLGHTITISLTPFFVV